MELERDAIGIAEIQRYRESLIVERVVFDAERVQARLPRLERGAVGDREREVIETDSVRRERGAFHDIVLGETRAPSATPARGWRRR